MWDDVIISKKGGFNNKGTGAYLCFEIEGSHSISQNSNSYWIDLNTSIEVGMTIFKDTKEGEMLTDMIKQKENIQKIEKYLLAVALKKISPKVLMKKIDKLSKEQFDKGRRAKVEELRKLLEIH